jgi:hypothetical protein
MPQQVCPDESKTCGNGRLVSRQGADCKMELCVEDGMLYTEVLWNTPLHSWTGVASEAVDYLVPLADRLPNLVRERVQGSRGRGQRLGFGVDAWRSRSGGRW